MQRSIATALGGLLALGTIACSGKSKLSEYRPGRVQVDLSDFDVEAMSTDGSVRGRVLGMSMAEIAARVEGVEYSSRASFQFAQGSRSVDTTTTHTVLYTPKGDYALVYETDDGRLERYLIGEDVYLRQDSGEMRRQARRDTNEVYWPDQAATGLADAIEAGKGFVGFKAPKAQKKGGRDALRYDLFKANARDAAFPYANKAESRIPGLWRDEAELLDVRGAIWIDKKTGVVLASDVQLKAEVPDRDIRPTQLELSFVQELKSLGEVSSIQAPEAREDYLRRIPPRDQLSFFREHLPALEEEAEAEQ